MRTRGKTSWKPFITILWVLVILSFSMPPLAEGTEPVSVNESEAAWAGSSSVPENYVFTGAATYKIPIKVPPGRNKLAPNIALTYNSYLGNGWVGVGWRLDMGFIRRSTKLGVDYTVGDYVFVKDGKSSELVARNDWGPDYYGAKIEQSFTKFFFNAAEDSWEVIAKDGTRYFYGTTGESRQDNAPDVFKWCLDRVEDTNGNYMTIGYAKDQEGQIYLDRIDYTG